MPIEIVVDKNEPGSTSFASIVRMCICSLVESGTADRVCHVGSHNDFKAGPGSCPRMQSQYLPQVARHMFCILRLSNLDRVHSRIYYNVDCADAQASD